MGSHSLSSTLGAQPARSDSQTRSRQQLTTNSTQHDHSQLTPTSATEGSNVFTTKESARKLETLAGRLNVLAAGSLFLLPSVLPYLASALTSLNDFQDDQTTLDRTINKWRAVITPMLPCLGLLLPIVAAKAQIRWRATRGQRVQNLHDCQQSGRRRRWPCPFRVVCRKSVLPVTTTTATPAETTEAQEKSKGHPDDLGRSTNLDRHTKSKSTPNSKKARLLLLSSLGLWMLLLAISSPLGLNNVVEFAVQSEGSSPSSPPLSLPRQGCDQDQEREAFGLPTGTMDLTWEEIQALVRAADEDLIMDSEWPLSTDDEYEDNSESTTPTADIPVIAETLRDPECLQGQAGERSLDDYSRSYDSQEQEQEQEPAERGKVLEYVPLWTDFWAFSLALTLGGALVGLGQVQRQVRDEISSIDQRLEEEQGEEALLAHKKTVSEDNRGSYWTCRIFAIMALFIHIYTVQLKDWDMPTATFLRLGAIGLCFTYGWIPENLPKASFADEINRAEEEPKVNEKARSYSVSVAME